MLISTVQQRDCLYIYYVSYFFIIVYPSVFVVVVVVISITLRDGSK